MDPARPEEETVALQVATGDLGPFIIDAAGQAMHDLSPLQSELAAYRPGSSRGTDALAAVLAEPMARDVAAVVACPSLKLWGRSGGGRTPVSTFAVCGRPATHPDLYVAVSPSFEGAYLFETLNGIEDVVAWWASTFAAPVEHDPPNLLPPPMELESLLYAFHTIDAFRRTTMEGMLKYESTASPAVAVGDFSSSMIRSLRSRDLRWLLPTFLELIPGLDVSRLDIRDEHLEFLVDHGLFEAAATLEDGTEELVFGEAGLYLGTEFHNGWVSSVGFELVTRTGGLESAQARGLLVPTPIANHLVLIDVQNEKLVNHQAMTLERIIAKMAKLMFFASEAAEEPPAAATSNKSGTEPAAPALIADSGEIHTLGDRTTIGRNADNDLVVDSSTTSGRHALLAFEAGSLTIEDLGSTNGTWIGRRRIEGQATLADGAELRLGEARFMVRIPVSAAEPPGIDRTVVSPSVPPHSPTTCPSCGCEISQGAKFCRSCGHALSP